MSRRLAGMQIDPRPLLPSICVRDGNGFRVRQRDKLKIVLIPGCHYGTRAKARHLFALDGKPLPKLLYERYLTVAHDVA